MKTLMLLVSAFMHSQWASAQSAFQLINCQVGDGPERVVLDQPSAELVVLKTESEDLVRFESINQGVKTKWIFISLGRQDRIDEQSVRTQVSLIKTQKRFGHLIGSPLGMPMTVTETQLNGLNAQQLQLVERKKDSFLSVLTPTLDCLYQSEDF